MHLLTLPVSLSVTLRQCIKFNDDGRGATAHVDYHCTASHDNTTAAPPTTTSGGSTLNLIPGLHQLPASFYAAIGATLSSVSRPWLEQLAEAEA